MKGTKKKSGKIAKIIVGGVFCTGLVGVACVAVAMSENQKRNQGVIRTNNVTDDIKETDDETLI